MTLSLGTSGGAMRMVIPEPWFSPIHATWLYRSVDNGFLLGAATSGCSNCVDWYKEHAFNPDVTYAQIEGSLREDSATPPIFLHSWWGGSVVQDGMTPGLQVSMMWMPP